MQHFFKILLATGCLLVSAGMYAQPTPTSNYVLTTVVKQPGIFNEASLSNVAIAYNGKAQTVSYFDGLGRAVQTVVPKGSATQKDIISPVEYDVLGREVKKYLPYVDLTSTSLV